jgi:hypothetical protein
VNEINSKIFLTDILSLGGGHLRLELPLMQINTVYTHLPALPSFLSKK